MQSVPGFTEPTEPTVYASSTAFKAEVIPEQVALKFDEMPGVPPNLNVETVAALRNQAPDLIAELAKNQINSYSLRLLDALHYDGMKPTNNLSDYAVNAVKEKSINIGRFATISKGGKNFLKQLRFPTILITGKLKTPPKAKTPTSLLLDLAGFAWRLLGYTGYAPSLFIKAMIAYFRQEAGALTNHSLSSANLKTLIGKLINTPLFQSFLYMKTLSKDGKAKLAEARKARIKLKEETNAIRKQIDKGGPETEQLIATAFSQPSLMPSTETPFTAITAATVLGEFRQTEGRVVDRRSAVEKQAAGWKIEKRAPA
jgi:hypothetical protein